MDVTAAVRAHLLAELGAPTGTAPLVASVTFLGLEPIEVLRFDSDDAVDIATLGCSRHAMGDPTEFVRDSLHGPRAELVLSVRGDSPALTGVHRSLAVLAAAPEMEGVVLKPDALLDLREPLWEGSPFTAVLLGSSVIPELALGDRADPVQFFQVAPLTATEAAWVRIRGPEALREAWDEAGIDMRDPTRAQVDVGGR